MPKTLSRSHRESVADDLELAGAVRSALTGVKAVTEVKMFGGIGFMLHGNLLVGASKRGLLLRVGKERQSQALDKSGTRPMEMRGRLMEGYVYVDPPIAPDTVRGWVEMARAFVGTLPPKRKAKRRPAKQKRTR
jgi:TfoX/Sxy family transcriptional regulator of competence genes